MMTQPSLVIACPVPAGALPDRCGYLELVARSGVWLRSLTRDPHTAVPTPRRFVALWWGAGDEAELSNGQLHGTAPVWQPFLDVLEGAGHLWRLMHALDFGSSDGPPAAVWLLGDRTGTAGWAVAAPLATRLIRHQTAHGLDWSLTGRLPDSSAGHQPAGEVDA